MGRVLAERQSRRQPEGFRASERSSNPRSESAPARSSGSCSSAPVCCSLVAVSAPPRRSEPVPSTALLTPGKKGIEKVDCLFDDRLGRPQLPRISRVLESFANAIEQILGVDLSAGRVVKEYLIVDFDIAVAFGSRGNVRVASNGVFDTWEATGCRPLLGTDDRSSYGPVDEEQEFVGV